MTFTQTQIQQAKNVDLWAVAQAMNLQPIHQTSNSIFFQNPFREESNASFHIFQSRNGYHLVKDFGTSKRALDAIAFIQQLKKWDFQQAVAFLLAFQGEKDVSFSFPKPSTNGGNGIEIRKMLPNIQNKALIQYLKSRKVNIQYAQKCPLLYECYYRPQGKIRANGRDFFGLAFQNSASGYDLRSATFKGKIGENTFSYLAHPKSRKIAVFEGFMDYLSALTYFQTEQSNHHVLVLNSTENKAKALAKLKEFEKVFLFLDNDQTGSKTVQYFQDNLKAVFDQSHIYQNYNDFNEFLHSNF